MEYFIGVVLSLIVAGMGGVGFDRDRSFYPVILILIATYYVLFAAMGASGRVVALESLAGAVFLVAAVIGFKRNLWLVVAALIAHGISDLVHRHFIDNPGVPAWWPGFCLAFDVVAGGVLAVLLVRRKNAVTD
jgi:hypothetical protein